MPTPVFCRTAKERFGAPPSREESVPVPTAASAYVLLHQNFIDAIRDGAPLIAPAREGIYSVELANAMLSSSWHGRSVGLPLDGAAYERLLRRWIRASSRKRARGRENPAV